MTLYCSVYALVGGYRGSGLTDDGVIVHGIDVHAPCPLGRREVDGCRPATIGLEAGLPEKRTAETAGDVRLAGTAAAASAAAAAEWRQ